MPLRHVVRRLVRAFFLAFEELALFFMGMGVLMSLAAWGIYYFEHPLQPEVFDSWFSSLWWSVVTLTTVGYGDMAPISTGGRVFTIFMLSIGLGLFFIPAGIFTDALARVRKQEQLKNSQP